MADAAQRLATYQVVLDAPPNRVAELIDGVLHTHPRPAGPHTAATTALGVELGPPFSRGRGGPGGWILLDEPEVHLGPHVLVPDLAAWRRERMPAVTAAPFFTLSPDWVCEVLSAPTAKLDRTAKLPITPGKASGTRGSSIRCSGRSRPSRSSTGAGRSSP